LDEWGGGSSSSGSSSSDSSCSSDRNCSSDSSSDEDNDKDRRLKTPSQPVQQRQRQDEQQQLKPNNPFAAAAGFKNIFASATPPASAAVVTVAQPVSDPLKAVPGASIFLFMFHSRDDVATLR
jgi:hypothetical protein